MFITDFVSNDNFTEIIIIHPNEESLMTFIGDFNIREITIVNSFQEIDVSLPSLFSFNDAFPNPFNPVTRLEFSLSKPGHFKASVYDMRGSLVDIILDKSIPEGNHVLEWNANQLPSGIYFIKAEYANKVISKKVTLLK